MGSTVTAIVVTVAVAVITLLHQDIFSEPLPDIGYPSFILGSDFLHNRPADKLEDSSVISSSLPILDLPLRHPHMRAPTNTWSNWEHQVFRIIVTRNDVQRPKDHKLLVKWSTCPIRPYEMSCIS